MWSLVKKKNMVKFSILVKKMSDFEAKTQAYPWCLCNKYHVIVPSSSVNQKTGPVIVTKESPSFHEGVKVA